MYMKRLLFSACPILLLTLTMLSQNSPSALNNDIKYKKPESFPQAQTQEEKNKKEMSSSPQGQNNLRLGLPAWASLKEYTAAKEKLYNEDRLKYNEIFHQDNPTAKSSFKTIARSDFNKMTKEQQTHVSSHPARFKIID